MNDAHYCVDIDSLLLWPGLMEALALALTSQLSTRHSHAATWGFSSAAAAAALAVAAVTTGGPAQLDNDALEPGEMAACTCLAA